MLERRGFQSRIHTSTGAEPAADLYLSRKKVGTIAVLGRDSSWTYGKFIPNPAFSEFAPIFGRWSLLMHEDETEPLTQAAADELRETEQKMDALHIRVHFPHDDTWHEVGQVNIDGDLIEWKCV